MRDTATTPASSAPTPAICSAVGASPKMSAPRTTEPIGWIVSSIDATAAGSRGSETEINSQPRICEVSASVTSHAWPGQVGTRSRSPMARPPASVVAAAAIVTSNSGPAGGRRSALDWRSTRMNPAYVSPVRIPKIAPAAGSRP